MTAFQVMLKYWWISLLPGSLATIFTSVNVNNCILLLTSDQQVAQEQVLEILPMVSEVNAVSEELNKHKSFEVVLISAAAQEGGDITHPQGTR